MTVAADVLVGLALFAAAIDWWGVARGRLSVEFIARPLVMIALIGAALAIETDADVTRGLVVAALGASLVADVVFMSPDARFEAGIVALAVGHVLYIAALAEAVEFGPTVAAALLVVGIGIGAVPQIVDGARRRHPAVAAVVAGFVVAAGAMVTMAGGTGVLIAAIGGALFLAADSLLLWDHYVAPAPGGTGRHRRRRRGVARRRGHPARSRCPSAPPASPHRTDGWASGPHRLPP